VQGMRSRSLDPGRRVTPVDRRTFLAGAATLVAIPLGVGAQQPPRVARIGRLSPLTAEGDVPFMNAFRQALRELGWVEGRSFTIVSRFAEGDAARLPRLAASLVEAGVDVILTGSNPGALAAKQAATGTPIVMVTTGDPIGAGIITSLAHPGSNLTGVTALGGELSAKRLEALKGAVPSAQRVAVLVNPSAPYTGPFLAEREGIARELGLRIRVVEARVPGDLEAAFAGMGRERDEALMVLTDVMFISERRAIVELAMRRRLPAMYFDRQFVDAGGLLFYGASLTHLYRRAAVYVDKVLKGVRPSDLPIEQPTTFELIVNLRAARAIGLTLPRAFLLRADQVIE
jgi:putative ABC transport system substrate-binding protein